MKPLYAVSAAGVHKHGSADNICGKKYRWVADRTVNMTFSGKIYYDIGLLLFKYPVNGFPVGNIGSAKSKVRLVCNCFKIVRIACICQRINAYYPVFGVIIHHIVYKITSDKSCAARDYNCHKDHTLPKMLNKIIQKYFYL